MNCFFVQDIMAQTFPFRRITLLIKVSLPISHIDGSRFVDSNTSGLTESGKLTAWIKGSTQSKGGSFITKGTKLEDLMHGNISHPKAPRVVNGQSVGHVEEGLTPCSLRGPRAGEFEHSGDFDQAMMNVAVSKVTVERAAKERVNITYRSGSGVEDLPKVPSDRSSMENVDVSICIDSHSCDLTQGDFRNGHSIQSPVLRRHQHTNHLTTTRMMGLGGGGWGCSMGGRDHFMSKWSCFMSGWSFCRSRCDLFMGYQVRY